MDEDAFTLMFPCDRDTLRSIIRELDHTHSKMMAVGLEKQTEKLDKIIDSLCELYMRKFKPKFDRLSKDEWSISLIIHDGAYPATPELDKYIEEMDSMIKTPYKERGSKGSDQ